MTFSKRLAAAVAAFRDPAPVRLAVPVKGEVMAVGPKGERRVVRNDKWVPAQ